MSLREVRAVTFDFGNTLVPVDRAGLERVVERTAEWLSPVVDRPAADIRSVWESERARQWREDVPRFRETDMRTRVIRVIARLRAVPAPPDDVPWDDRAAAGYSTTDEVAGALETYSEAFATMPPTPGVGALLQRLSGRGLALAILSNWPLAAAIDRYADSHGWTPLLAGIVVSERVGTIKPQPGMFLAAEEVLGLADSPHAILHVGDDPVADVVGAKRAGWQAGLVRGRPADSPLPIAEDDGPTAEPDIVLDRLTDLEGMLVR